LLSFMYLCHLLVIRKDVFFRVGGLRSAFDGSQDHDLALRATEVAKRVGHIPKVLYHFRAHSSSTAWSGRAKPGSAQAGQMAVEQALARRGIQARVYLPGWAAAGAGSFFSQRFPDRGPHVAVVIPTRNQLKFLRSCVDSLAKTTYADFKVFIVDNGSDDPDTLAYLEKVPHRVLRIPRVVGRGSFAEVTNEAVKLLD